MFGYVRPLRGELKCSQYDQYRAFYCGLCRTMRRRCGLAASLSLNYDFTFLAVLLTGGGEAAERLCRCPVPPFRRKCACEQSPAMEIAADESVILTYWQLADKAADEPFFPSLGARLARLLLTPAYRRCVRRCGQFDQTVRRQLASLRRLEEERCPAVDPPADAFASILRAAAPHTGEESVDRPMEQLLYHLGRWIYLIDARDDLDADAASGNYNPVALRYGAEERDAALEATLNQSLSLMRASAALLDFGGRAGLVDNVLDLGLPAVQSGVFSGRWKKSNTDGLENGTNERSVQRIGNTAQRQR